MDRERRIVGRNLLLLGPRSVRSVLLVGVLVCLLATATTGTALAAMAHMHRDTGRQARHHASLSSSGIPGYNQAVVDRAIAQIQKLERELEGLLGHERRHRVRHRPRV